MWLFLHDVNKDNKIQRCRGRKTLKRRRFVYKQNLWQFSTKLLSNTLFILSKNNSLTWMRAYTSDFQILRETNQNEIEIGDLT